jgi:hypothetical protein
MTEDGFAAFDQAAAVSVSNMDTADRPDPSNLQVAAGSGLTGNQDSVGTFDSKAAAERANTALHGPQSQLLLPVRNKLTQPRVSFLSRRTLFL